jgi:cytochrome P450/NADPH-cytochrome P450 reductase
MTLPRASTLDVMWRMFNRHDTPQIEILMDLVRENGPVFAMEMPGGRMIAVASSEASDEVCDDSRYDKLIGPAFERAKRFAGDGLVTTKTTDEAWIKAHRVLMPAFSTEAIHAYLPQMEEIAEQLLAKWDQKGGSQDIDVPAELTALTLDTIGLCGFGYRFDSITRKAPHPFLIALADALQSAQGGTFQPALLRKLAGRAGRRRTEQDAAVMKDTVDRVIAERKASGERRRDLLDVMLNGVDRGSGTVMDDALIRDEIITFLVAGHETTSGLLSFAIWLLMSHPDAMRRARDEVDRVFGRDLAAPPGIEQVMALQYVGQVLKEALRLYPPIPLIVRTPRAEEKLLGRYPVHPGDRMVIVIPSLHRDPEAWSDAEAFDPDRFSPENEARIPPNAYKPFGTGQRACIGRSFALQEASLVLGRLLQRYEFHNPHNYQLHVRHAFSVKPVDFLIRVTKRPSPLPSPVESHATPLTVLFGSNMGCSERLANKMADDGRARGFSPTVAALDDFVDRLPHDGVVVVVTSSYNGTPPDNAASFCRWLDALSSGALEGVRYALFGCGNREWASTFQAVPRHVDEGLAGHGAERIMPRGEGDQAGDFDGQFQAWYAGLWPAIERALGVSVKTIGAGSEPLYSVEVLEETLSNPFVESFDARPLVVVENRELHAPSSPRSARHIELALHEDMRYRAGDHLGVLPRNPGEMVRRVAARFGFDEHTRIRLHQTGSGRTILPLEQIVSLRRVLGDFLELHDVATREQIRALAERTREGGERRRLASLAAEDERYRAEVLVPNRSLIDLLEETPSCELPFASFLEMLSPLRPRYYSISSSPQLSGAIASITVGLVKAPARSGHGTYAGVCSSFLAGLPRGAIVHAFVEQTRSAFRLPGSPLTPIVMVGPGTGLAPFRGFLQERTAARNRGESLGPAMLFFGCRNPDEDYIYRDELEAMAGQGIVDLHVAFSRLAGEPAAHVQDRIAERKDEVWSLIEKGAVVYVCGDGALMAPEVRKSFERICGEHVSDGAAFVSEMEKDNRYLTDVWAGVGRVP